jgi:hypothetical protein
MPSSGMLCSVALVRNGVSEECIASIIRVIRISKLGATLAVTSDRSMLRRNRLLVTANVAPSALILFTLIMETSHSSETSVLARATRRHIPEDGILHGYRLENIKSNILFDLLIKQL